MRRRTKRATSAFDAASNDTIYGRVYGFGVTGDKKKWNWTNTPREVVGEGVVLRTGTNSSTILTTYSLRDFYVGGLRADHVRCGPTPGIAFEGSDLPFKGAHRFKVFIETPSVALPEIAAYALGVLTDRVEHAAAIEVSLGIAEHPGKHRADRSRLRWVRRGRARRRSASACCGPRCCSLVPGSAEGFHG